MREQENDIDKEQSINLMEYAEVVWRRKWLILLPTIGCAILAGIYSFSLPKKWEITALIQPGKFTNQTVDGKLEEVVVTDPKQLAAQINQEAYNNLVAAELNLDIRKFPVLLAESLKDTRLVKVSIRDKDVQKSKAVISSLFSLVKSDLDKRIDVEIKTIDAQNVNTENMIKQKNVDIQSSGLAKENLNLDIQSSELEKENLRKEISTFQNKLAISELRVKNLLEEMKSVKTRAESIDEQQKKILTEKKEGNEAISILLYSNEIQQNLRYYNSLEDSMSNEKVNQENLKLSVEAKTNAIKNVSLNIETKRNAIKQIDTQIEKTKNDIDGLKNQITLSTQKKGRIDYTSLTKEPTSSLYPVAPNKKQNILIAGVLAFLAFTSLAIFLDSMKRYKSKSQE
jgi:capsular polysaccharide biosynthesis protein